MPGRENSRKDGSVSVKETARQEQMERVWRDWEAGVELLYSILFYKSIKTLVCEGVYILRIYIALGKLERQTLFRI